ncbi:MAG: hypothetical protein LBR94_05295 [Desulfovibrio sp.]|jgi:hypothetical protein|nr:hypothetical protein [Desulfovibrio sp.]
MRSVISTSVRAAALLAVLLMSTAAAVSAAPLATKYYSLELPPDWKVIDGPKVKKDIVHVLLGQIKYKCSASVTVSSSAPGEAEKKAREAAKLLNGTKPALRNGQLEFTFKKMGDRGYCILREDRQAKLLIMLIVSGDVRQANFIYSMRSGYPALVPARPSNLW